MIKGDQDALGHPQRPRQAQPWGVQQVPVMNIKIWHGTCLYTIFQRQIDLKQSQRDIGWSRCSWTPSATSSRSTMGSSASTTYVYQKLTWHMFKCYFSKTNRFKTVSALYRVIKITLYYYGTVLNQFNNLSVIQGDQDVLGHPQRPRQAQLRRVQQVPVMIIKIWHCTCLNNNFQR